MKYLSLCSGIEAATVAWHPLGWSAVACSEIEKFPSAVLAHHYPAIPNLGDMEKFNEWPDADVDVLVGGTPCQSFSVAGLRKGLADPRGNLALVYLAIADRYRPEWLVWENVPGARSVDGGRALGAFLGGLGQLGYGWAYRSLDAQYAGLAQRRERVFVVANSRSWQRAAAVLFERESLSGDTPACVAARQDAARRSAKATGGGRLWRQIARAFGAGEQVGVVTSHDPAVTLSAREYKGALPKADLSTVVAHSLRAEGFDASEDGTGRGTPLVPVVANPLGAKKDGGWRGALDGDTYIPFDTTQITSAANRSSPKPGDPCHPLASGAHPPAIAIQERAVSEGTSGPDGKGWKEDVAYTLEARNKVQNVAQGYAIRRLTPRECERLQGFPDDYTAIPWRGKPPEQCPDGPRYKALGNSMPVPVMRWIGERIEFVNSVS